MVKHASRSLHGQARWTSRSGMPCTYLHTNPNLVSQAILEGQGALHRSESQELVHKG